VSCTLAARRPHALAMLSSWATEGLPRLEPMVADQLRHGQLLAMLKRDDNQRAEKRRARRRYGFGHPIFTMTAFDDNTLGISSCGSNCSCSTFTEFSC